MSHPALSYLIPRRDRGELDDAVWRGALAHAEGCEACRRRLLAADPSLVFQALPPAVLSSDELEEMRRNVTLLRRTSPHARPSSRRQRLPGWRWVAAALVTAGLGWFGATVGHESPQLVETVARSASPSPIDRLAATRDWGSQPVFEEIDEPYQQVVEWSDEELSVVLVVDERLDV